MTEVTSKRPRIIKKSCKRDDSKRSYPPVCEGDGMCLLQGDDGSHPNSVNYACPHRCWPRPCNTCGDLMPLYVLHCYGGRCTSCDCRKWCENERALKRKRNHKGPGYCELCNKHIVPIGSSRLGGACHDDWSSRKFHKACWIQLQKPKWEAEERKMKNLMKRMREKQRKGPLFDFLKNFKYKTAQSKNSSITVGDERKMEMSDEIAMDLYGP